MMNTFAFGCFLGMGTVVLLFNAQAQEIGQVMKDNCSPCNCSTILYNGTKSLQADCSNLSLTTVDNLALPNQIRVLLLGENLLTGIKASDFTRYHDLIVLNLSSNRINQTIDPGLTDTPSVRSNINVLLLDHNHFNRIDDFEFSQFPFLTTLDLSYNAIDDMATKAFANLTNLIYLNLENNTLEASNFSSDLFSELKNLKTLKLNNNTLGDYPHEALSHLQSLEALFIDGLNDTDFGPGFQNLTKLTNLTLSGRPGYGTCNITVLHNSTFTNLTYLENLDISKCSVSIIEAGTFMPLENLQYLDISVNYKLGLKMFGTGMYGLPSGIKTLKANNIVPIHKSCVIIKKQHIQYLSNTSLTHLYLDDNEIENIYPDVIPLLPKSLNFISAQRNKFSYGKYIRELHTMTNLTEVWLSGHAYPMDVPEYDPSSDTMYSCESEECMGFEEDEVELDVASSSVQSRGYWHEDTLGSMNRYADFQIFNFSVPPNLQIIRFNFTQMTFAIGRIKFDPNKIVHLDLSSNLVQFQKGHLLGLDNVTYIDLSNNLARKMSKELLVNCRELETLNISFNFFGWQIQSDANGTIFKNLSKLKHLIICNNDLKGLSASVFQDLTALEVLNVSSNGMYNFSPELKNMTKLKFIDCSNNQIKWLQQDTMDDLTNVKKTSRNFTLILRSNPLSCECQNIGTLKWLLDSGVTPDNMHGYYCLLNKVRTKIKNKEDFKKLIRKITAECKNNFGLALGCVAIFIAASGLMVGAIMYRYRWKLRYLYYAARLRYLADNVPEDEEDNEFIFDAFVSYADEDRGFVINDMRSRLEHEASMKLNIHHRDFMPGEPIVSNIVGAIKKSRKTLVLLSKNFLKSYWCRYELHMAQMESISSGRDIIIVIMYESVPAKSIPPEFLHLLQSDSYIEYPSDEVNMDVFWTHLSRAVRHRSNRPSSVSSQP